MKNTILFSSVLTLAMVVGCDDKKEAPKPQAPAQAQPSQKSETTAVDQAKVAIDQGKQQVTQAVTDAKAEGSKLVDQAKVEGQKVVDQTAQQVTDTKKAVTQQVNQFTNVAPTTAASAAETFDYKAKMTEAMTYVKEHKLELADKSLTQVEQHKTSIPADYYPKIDSLRKMIDSAKAAQNTGITLPKF